MKKIKLLLVSLFLLTLNSFGQTDFKWDKIDSVSKNKTEIYTLTKMYIAETWKSAQDVIQNDDKEGGVILIKGISIKNLYFQMNDHRWTFSYTVKFMFKDNKYRILVDNVYCQSARCRQYEWALMPVADKYPSKKGLGITNLNEERYLDLMKLLKYELQTIVDGYGIYLNTNSINKSNW